MHHLHTLVTVLQTTTAFTVLPYIQIDYAHYFHLAQCQAKCMQKYGILSKRYLLDGSVEEYLDIQSSNAVACESGCHQHRRAHRKELMGQTKNAVADGHRFWIDSSAESAKVGSTLISSVELACQNSSPDEEFGESAEGFVKISLLRPSGPTKFVVQWKQRTQMMGYYDESQWITSSVESGTFFKVNGFIPGVQYRFMVTAVGPSGRIGETVSSSWAEISNNSPPKGLTPTLTIKNGYNPESGVTAQLVWPSVSLNSCYYKLQLSNSSFHFTTDITMDASRSILLTHLEFDTDYSITMAAISSDKIYVGSPVTVNFKSFPCKDVYGRGSLHCLPEPVTNLAIIIRTNGTGIVSWKPVADPQNVLFYQIIYYALSHKNGCRSHKEIVNVNSTASFAEVNLPGHQCEYVIQLISYDLIGRDALAEARVLIESNLPYSFSRFLRPEIVIIIFCLILFLFSYVLYRLRWKRKCPNRVSEKQQKLNDYS